MQTKRIFIMGITGYIGGSVGVRLAAAGYQVTGLVRKAADVARITALGIRAVHGSLYDPIFLQDNFRDQDIVINLTDADDAFAATAILDALQGTDTLFIHTSGAGIIGDKAAGAYTGTQIHDSFPTHPLLERAGRAAIDREILRRANTVVICPAMVYGPGTGLKPDSDQIPALMRAAVNYRQGIYVGAGLHVSSHVHIDDLTQLYLLAIDKAVPGSYYFAANGQTPFREMATAISTRLGFGGVTTSIPLATAIDLWGPAKAHFGLGSNILVSSEKARQELDWTPVHTDLLSDILTSPLPADLPYPV
ncbi:NAD-dependent epimerase/dehydratase family protein [Chitinophaga nivalis]|uniref:NAD-dependent epimerase/dehydratase family protein n=1 Tax=Chitinophaga nivalis TaxID=2991709 RepID=A0ABT3ILX1_9BACT|nr:NAD-dependent epimerase/dehydratase family protein [Chitinophaga nivalis]MCW3465338.1 NAD-dependent epimerase/dehydratase family protein [Chitinophaga nivalis]MCW3484970.1 NAD-dependent epimerase/dehydratase family protein [Chitinophaga nivalis]